MTTPTLSDALSDTLADELAHVLGTLRIHTWDSFSFGDDPPMTVLPGPWPALPGPPANAPVDPQSGTALSYLLASVRDTLYARCYTRSAPAPVLPAGLSAEAFTAQLAAANQTVERWDPGWSIYHLAGNGGVQVQKGERCRTAVQGEYITNLPPGMAPRVGDQVALRVCPGSLVMQPGFYFAFGATLADQFDEHALLRFYFNLQAEGAAAWLHALTGRLNRYLIPFRYKTLAHPAAYTRADAAVLYVARRHYAATAAHVGALADDHAGSFRPGTPLFSRTLRPGIGLAEEPGTGESFGMHRCRLLAEGIVDAWLAGSQAVEARLAAVRRRFEALGLRLEHAHLNPNSLELPAPAGPAIGIQA